MDALHFIKEMLSEPSLRDFLSDNVHDDVNSLNLIVTKLIKVQIFMSSTKFRVHPEDQKLALIESLQLAASKVGNFMSKFDGCASRKQSSSSGIQNLVKDWKETLDFINCIVDSNNYLEQIEETVGDLDTVINSIKNLLLDPKNLLLDPENSSNCIALDKEKSKALILVKAIPVLGELKEYTEIFNLLLESSKELRNLPELISMECEAQPLALGLIGSLLSLKERAYHSWWKVKDDLCRIKESFNLATNNHMWHIFNYCYDDLPYFLKPCFLYLAFYPINHEISARSLTEIWIAEGFVTPKIGENKEETANVYLEKLAQRSLVWVTKRSLLGPIKYCRVPCPIHEFVIKQSGNDGFMAANPDKKKIESRFRVAIHDDVNNQYTVVQNNCLRSFSGFNLDRDVLVSAMFLRVLELRNSVLQETSLLQNMYYLQYLGLRGSKISELPGNIENMKNLQTLDVRNTCIKTLPESLWNIRTLRHVYVTPSPEIQGPPPTANLSDLQILKTVVIPELWLERFPHSLMNLRELALAYRDIQYRIPNPYSKFTSILLSHMVNLLSIVIIGDIIPSEIVDTRAFPNLETVKSYKLVGKWSSRRISIDYVEFPQNLTKLTLIKSGLTKDPMPRLEKLQALKYLSLVNQAYTGKEMVCTANGFPQLQFLELIKLENLENLKVIPTAMSQLATLRIVNCQKLKKPHNLEHLLKA